MGVGTQGVSRSPLGIQQESTAVSPSEAPWCQAAGAGPADLGSGVFSSPGASARCSAPGESAAFLQFPREGHTATPHTLHFSAACEGPMYRCSDMVYGHLSMQPTLPQTCLMITWPRWLPGAREHSHPDFSGKGPSGLTELVYPGRSVHNAYTGHYRDTTSTQKDILQGCPSGHLGILFAVNL